jgi:hypothetical protein
MDMETEPQLLTMATAMQTQTWNMDTVMLRLLLI